MRRSRSGEGVAKIVGVGAGFFLLALVLLFHQTVFRIAGGVVALVTTPPQEAYEALPKDVLVARVVDLERELSRVRYQALLYQTLSDELMRLEELLNLPTDEVVATARVVSRPPRTHYDTLLLELSSGHRVSVGDGVFFERVKLGAISTVSGNAATVALLSLPGARTDARAGDPTGIVILEGLGGGAFTFDVPVSVSIEPGDVVVDASNDLHALAVVARVNEEPDKTVKTVYAHAPVSLFEVRYVSVERGE